MTIKEGGPTRPFKKNPVRVPEETMRVYIKAYEDAQGNYHHDSELNLVVREAYWKQEIEGL